MARRKTDVRVEAALTAKDRRGLAGLAGGCSKMTKKQAKAAIAAARRAEAVTNASAEQVRARQAVFHKAVCAKGQWGAEPWAAAWSDPRERHVQHDWSKRLHEARPAPLVEPAPQRWADMSAAEREHIVDDMVIAAAEGAGRRISRAEALRYAKARFARPEADDFERDDDFDRRAGADEARVAASLKTWADNAEDDEGFRGLAAIPSASSLPITFGRAAPYAREHSRVDLSGGFVAFRGTKKRRRR